MGHEPYGPEEASRDLSLVGQGTASFEERARIENCLLGLLKDQGYQAVASFLQTLSGHRFRRTDDGEQGQEIRFESERYGNRAIVVRAFHGEHFSSVSVAAEEESTDTPVPDPRHQEFYDIWESLLGIQDSAVARLEHKEKAVFLTGLLEAEVMNGGYGQYLANTEGVYLEETIDCLDRIGAELTRTLLVEAGKLASKAGSCSAAWELYADELEKLDARFLASGEDLAVLTVEMFNDRDAGESRAEMDAADRSRGNDDGTGKE